MKNEKKAEARKLRQEGLSMREITRKIGVSKASVSYWVRDIVLTKEQKNHLSSKISSEFEQASKAHTEKSLEKRKTFQEQGRKTAQLKNIRHAMGCMLYWAEGYKKNNKNTMKFSNSDPYMNKFFISFLKEFFSLENDDISLYLNLYTDLVELSEAEKFWLDFLSLPKNCLRKSVVNNISSYSKKKRCGLLKYGTCAIVVNRTDVIQQIYGSIQEYAEFKNDLWLCGH